MPGCGSARPLLRSDVAVARTVGDRNGFPSPMRRNARRHDSNSSLVCGKMNANRTSYVDSRARLCQGPRVLVYREDGEVVAILIGRTAWINSDAPRRYATHALPSNRPHCGNSRRHIESENRVVPPVGRVSKATRRVDANSGSIFYSSPPIRYN
jgi:hypothetical protein